VKRVGHGHFTVHDEGGRDRRTRRIQRTMSVER
jgi:hypothetical protein